MTCTEKFLKLVKKGKLGEVAFAKWCNKNAIEWKDLSNDEYWQKKDVDFEAKYGDKVKLVEVKTDTVLHKYGNFAVELNQHRAREFKDSELGWYYTSKADLMAVYEPTNKKLYLFDFTEFQIFVALNYEKYKLKTKEDYMGSGKTKIRAFLCVRMSDFLNWMNERKKPVIIEQM